MSSIASIVNHLLGQRNVDHVLQLCLQFLREKYQINIQESQLRSILIKCMNELLDLYKDNQQQLPSVDEFNKQTIVRAKQQIMIHVREISSTPSHPPPPEPKPIVVPQSLQPPPPPVPPSPIMEEQDQSEDSETFLKKLQTLELQRNASVVPNTTPPPVREPLFQTKSQGTVAGPPASSGTTVLYLPSPQTALSIPSSKPFVVHSGDRLWNYFHDRSILSWEGPLPSQDTYMKCTSLLISPQTYIVSPIIRVCIEGPGGHTCETICTFSQKGRKWDCWAPASETIGTLRTVPCPWTIRLYDVTGRLLDLGKDGYSIKEATHLLNGNTKWVLHESIPMLMRGMTILCQGKDGSIRRHTALHVHENSIEVEGKHLDVNDCVCAVEDLQVTIIFEIIKNETIQPVNTNGNTAVPSRTVGNGTPRGTIGTSSKSGK